MTAVNHVENGITLRLKGNHVVPRKPGTFFNPKMLVNRSVTVFSSHALG